MSKLTETLYPSTPKAIVTIHPYQEVSWKGWVTAIQDPETAELVHRPFYYKADAIGLAKDVEGKTFDEIIGIYGWKYFEKVR